MKYSAAILASILGLVSASPSSFDKRSNPEGCDVSSYQGNVDWAKVKADGASFAIIKVSNILLTIDVIAISNLHRLLKAPTIPILISPSNMTAPTMKVSSEEPTTSLIQAPPPGLLKLSTSSPMEVGGQQMARLFPA